MNLRELSELYHETYQRDSVSPEALRAWHEIAGVLVRMYGAHGLWVDVGCGGGGLLYALGEHGQRALGIEGSVYAMGHLPVEIWLHDLRDPLPEGWREAMAADVVTCFDVAEHVGAADVLVDTLAALTGRHLVFGAAPPGQDGLGHIDCQPPEAWRERFEACGLRYRPDVTAGLKADISACEGTNFLWWVEKNLQAFERRA